MTLELKLGTLLAAGRVAVAAAALAFGLLQPARLAAGDTQPAPPQDNPEVEDVAMAAEDEAQGAEADDVEDDVEGDEEDLSEQWGIEVTSIRLTASDHMIDFRYRVLDAEKAKELFVRQNKPALIHQETGKVLMVPETAKVGPLRNSDTPKEGKIYWMFFGNGGKLVKHGDQVTVVIGEFRAEDLVVE
ncbi:MAG TPA: hypothetical protein PKJ99_04160 [Thermoanaerobaculales bacterium]|nr:hypothetical protein [Thermoanaerobaculales bacterium]HPA79761.1 hypothetical protein [Thermoanaerobaculales bacterium]HQN94747.1 hypothetical protein [Thermoanaerobaculales bacterium]HQP42372.1 hypothetical protein [Thermoanaerobaculales bacterium]